jgi:hypothetical protein
LCGLHAPVSEQHSKAFAELQRFLFHEGGSTKTALRCFAEFVALSPAVRMLATFSTGLTRLFGIVREITRPSPLLGAGFIRIARLALSPLIRLSGRSLVRLLAAFSTRFARLLGIIRKVARSPALTLVFIRHDVLLEVLLDLARDAN